MLHIKLNPIFPITVTHQNLSFRICLKFPAASSIRPDLSEEEIPRIRDDKLLDCA